jgi:nucleoid-associated protein YgaU
MNTKKKISIKELLVGTLTVFLMIGCSYASKEQIEEIEAREQTVNELKREVGNAEETLSGFEKGGSAAEETTGESVPPESSCKRMKLSPSEADAFIKTLTEEEENLKMKLADLQAKIDARRTGVPASDEKTVEFETEKAVIDEIPDKIPDKITDKITSQVSSYKVKKGDYLCKIAERAEIYGHGKYARWKEIYNANRDKIKKPDLIHPGQNLVIPRP